MLLAMKVLAHRVEDAEDIVLLASMLELGSASEILDLAEEVFGDRLEPAARFRVQELFSR